ncbi:hypothetical protein C8034_v006197 [Colletotrichum sidae]|uniref:Uncharacterized protein n=1 Tax=Colletotrichum sidae TaxID=1347389 RepID=A0A4R8T589_9PEZI|nr:hypothetical protein C8034_v006197 [Colletotrichum sidae]
MSSQTDNTSASQASSPQQETLQPTRRANTLREKTENDIQRRTSRTETSESEYSTRDAGSQVARRRRKDRQDMVQNKQVGEPHTQQSQDGQRLAPQNQQVQSKGKGAPSVRLDMDLDVEIDLKAKIKGDLELSIL